MTGHGTANVVLPEPVDAGSSGFTIVELAVTVFVAALFAISLIGLFTTFNYFMAAARQESVADSYAYNLLQRYTSPNYTSASWFNCDDAAGSANTNDRTVNPYAAGSPLDAGDIDADAAGLPSPARFSIAAYAPYGCADTNNPQSIMVIARVTYGKNAKVITHAAYAQGF